MNLELDFGWCDGGQKDLEVHFFGANEQHAPHKQNPLSAVCCSLFMVAYLLCPPFLLNFK